MIRRTLVVTLFLIASSVGATWHGQMANAAVNVQPHCWYSGNIYQKVWNDANGAIPTSLDGNSKYGSAVEDLSSGCTGGAMYLLRSYFALDPSFKPSNGCPGPHAFLRFPRYMTDACHQDVDTTVVSTNSNYAFFNLATLWTPCTGNSYWGRPYYYFVNDYGYQYWNGASYTQVWLGSVAKRFVLTSGCYY